MKPTPEKKAKLATLSNDVAMCVGEVIHAAEAIRGICACGLPPNEGHINVGGSFEVKNVLALYAFGSEILFEKY